MFTGLVEATGQVATVEKSAAGLRFRLRTGLAPALTPGDSLSVSGVCLTVVTAEDGIVQMDVSPETIRLTTLGELAPGSVVNLERPLSANARLGGHFVQGHVDGTGAIAGIEPQGESYWVSVQYPPEMARLIVHKGSIAVDGISLTVAGVRDDQFDVQIIPFTWQHTNLHGVHPGTRVNLETDILGKYVARAMDVATAGSESARRK